MTKRKSRTKLTGGCFSAGDRSDEQYLRKLRKSFANQDKKLSAIADQAIELDKVLREMRRLYQEITKAKTT